MTTRQRKRILALITIIFASFILVKMLSCYSTLNYFRHEFAENEFYSANAIGYDGNSYEEKLEKQLSEFKAENSFIVTILENGLYACFTVLFLLFVIYLCVLKLKVPKKRIKSPRAYKAYKEGSICYPATATIHNGCYHSLRKKRS